MMIHEPNIVCDLPVDEKSATKYGHVWTDGVELCNTPPNTHRHTSTFL